MTVLLFLMAVAFNAPVASVIAPSGVVIRGVEMYAPGVFSWPVGSGDEVQAKDGALVLFRDGTRLYLAKDCRIKLESATRVRVIGGALTFRLAEKSAVTVAGGDGKAATAAPAFTWTASELMRQLNWTLGVYLP